MKDVEKMAHLQAIIQTYEKGMKFDQTSKGVSLSISSSLYDLSSFVDILIVYLESFMGVNGKSKQEKQVLSDLGDISSYIDECFDCDGRIGFDFQFVPDSFLLAQLEAFLNELKNLLRDIELAFGGGENKLKTLCAFLSLFKDFPCPQDIALIILSLKMYLNRLLSLTIDIKLDWFSIVGPILQALSNLINQLFDMIINLIEAPIDCALNNLSVNLTLLQQENPSYITPESKPPEPKLIEEPNTKYLDIVSLVTANKVSDYDLNPEFFVSPEGKAIEPKPIENEFYSKEVRTNEVSGILKSVDLGFTLDLKLEDLLGLPDDKNGFLDMTMPEQIVSIILEVKKYLANLKASIKDNMAVFLQLTSGNKLLEIKRFLLCGVIIDFISILGYLLKNKINLKDLASICNNQEKKQAFEKLISDFTGISGTVTYGTDYLTLKYLDESGNEKDIILNSCESAAQAADNAIVELKNILSQKGAK